jgi:hypothetical protein
LGPNYYILAKIFFGTVFLFNNTYGGNLLPFVVIYSMIVTRNNT